ncbi:ubiquitin family protein [Cryptosporidium andersoni]|uniref:Ubiquitin family protein n=1 Tax=Cryptosporidium andersoni TaxID=117008 RepID=A0A1J4MF33_9CRYT|nr:ubiquitin family protein [Cryptosporidium andersoni]
MNNSEDNSSDSNADECMLDSRELYDNQYEISNTEQLTNSNLNNQNNELQKTDNNEHIEGRQSNQHIQSENTLNETINNTGDGYVVIESIDEVDSDNETELYEINVRPLHGRDLSVRASPNSSIRQLKVLIEAKSGIEANNQRLIFRGRCMQDDEAISTYIKESGVIIHLVPYLRQSNNSESSTSNNQSNNNTNTNNINNTNNTSTNFISGLNTATFSHFPGAMMFGAVRLDTGGDGNIPIEAEDFMQRILRSFGEAAVGLNGEGVILGSHTTNSGNGGTTTGNITTLNTTSSTNQVPNVNNISTFTGLNSLVNNQGESVLPGDNSSNTHNQTNTSSNHNVNTSINNNINNTGNNSNTGTTSVPDNNGVNTPIGRIGSMVSRLFQAFNNPNIISTPNSQDTNNNFNTGTNNSTVNTDTTNMAGINNNRVTENETTSNDTSRNRINQTSSINWAQLAHASGLTGATRASFLPLGRPGLAVATVPVSSLSIPITIRTTTSVPNIQSNGTSQSHSRNTTLPHNTNTNTNTNTISSQNINTNTNTNLSQNTQNIHNEAYRIGSLNFFSNISNILESSANQLQVVAQAINTMANTEPSYNGSSTLPPIPMGNSNNSNIPDIYTMSPSEYIQHHSHRLYISNEIIQRYLPWDSLNEIMNILEADSGWQRPRITIPPSLIEPPDVGPLAVFISVYLQVLAIIQVNLMQIQAWQERFSRLDVPRICRTVHLLALISHVSAHLGALLAWLFHNMAQHVEQDRLVESLQWVRTSNNSDILISNSQNFLKNTDSNHDNNHPENYKIEDSVSSSHQDSNSMIIDQINSNSINQSQRSHLVRSKDEIEQAVSDQGTPNDREDKRARKNSDIEVSSEQRIINELPSNIRDSWICWTEDIQGFSKDIFDTISSNPFSNAYRSGDPSSNNSISQATSPIPNSSNFDRGSSGNTVSVFSSNIPSSSDLLRMLIHQTESNLNLEISVSNILQDFESSYLSLLVNDLLERVRSDSDFLCDQQRFPNIKRVLEYLGKYQSNISK